MRKCFDSLKQVVDTGKTEKYSYYAAKYKSEAELKHKYFQMFAAFARTNVKNIHIIRNVAIVKSSSQIKICLICTFKADQENQT